MAKGPRQIFVPSPKGLDYRVLTDPNIPTSAGQIYNLRCVKRGLETMPYARVTNVTAVGAKTIFTHNALEDFVATDTGITSGPTSAAIIHAFGGVSEAGVVCPITVSTSAGAFTLVLNGQDTPAIYNGTSWAAVSWSGTTLSNLFQAVSYRERLYIADKTGQRFWYLSPDAVAGTLTVFNCGGLLSRGGRLVSLATYSRDGGNGPDDYLCAWFAGGELIVFGGNDPASQDWTVVGVYDVGKPAVQVDVTGHAVYHQVTAKLGGDVLLASVVGLLRLSEVVSGKDIATIQTLSDPIQWYWKRWLESSDINLFVAHTEKMLFVSAIRPLSSVLNRGDTLVMDLETGGWSQMMTNYRARSFTPMWVQDEYRILALVMDGTTYSIFGGTALYLSGQNSYDPWCVTTSYSRLGGLEDIRVLSMRPITTVQVGEASGNPKPRFKAGFAMDFSADYATADFSTVWRTVNTPYGNWDLDLAVTSSNAVRYRSQGWKTINGPVGMAVSLGMSGPAGTIDFLNQADDHALKFEIEGWDLRYEPVELLGS